MVVTAKVSSCVPYRLKKLPFHAFSFFQPVFNQEAAMTIGDIAASSG